MPINSDSLLNFTFLTLDYEKTINLCDCQKKFRTYDPNFIRDQNPILSYKTYQDNLQILKDMIHFTSPYGNPAIYFHKALSFNSTMFFSKRPTGKTIRRSLLHSFLPFSAILLYIS